MCKRGYNRYGESAEDFKHEWAMFQKDVKENIKILIQSPAWDKNMHKNILLKILQGNEESIS